VGTLGESAMNRELVDAAVEALRRHGCDRTLMSKIPQEDFEQLVSDCADAVDEDCADRTDVPSRKEYLDMVAVRVVDRLFRDYHEGR